MITAAQLKLGQRGVIREFTDTPLPIKLLEMGCLPGNLVELVQVAPLNDPVYLNVNGSHIAIRRGMAAQIALDLVEDPISP